MGISSLGIGSGILTQDVLDQLREVDDAQRVRPIALNLSNEKDKQNALEVLDATMTNLIDSITEIKRASLWDERKASVTSGSSVSVSAIAKTDLQEFTLDVTALATKQIEQSGQFGSEDEKIATAAGVLNLNIDGVDFEIAYDADTSLADLKKLINDTAGEKVNATIIKINDTDSRLFISSVDTGTTQDITISDNADGLGGNLNGSRLTTQMDVLTLGLEVDGITPITSAGSDASFTFNGQAITRTSNNVNDLITGLDITLEKIGVSEISIEQDRTEIIGKFESFVSKYNASIKELDKLTLVSTESNERGIFSNDSTVKNMKRTIANMMESVGGSVSSLFDYGFDIDKDGKMSFDKTGFEKKMDSNSENVQAFFSGGDFTNDDNTITSLTGSFLEMSTIVEGFTKTNKTLDQLKESFSQSISNYEERRESAVERLDAKYEIMKKQFAAYDLIINRFKSASSIFTQIIDAQNS